METSPFNPVTAELARLPERLESLLATSTEARWLERRAPGEWSAKEIAGHLADAARIYHERLRQILSEDRPQLARYDEARLASEHSYQQADLGETLRSVRTWRERTVALLASLPSPAWSRIGVHEETGEITLLQIAAHMVEHEADHLRGIARALGAMSVSAAV